MSARRPSFDEATKALIDSGVPESSDLLVLVQETVRVHYSDEPNADRTGHYGLCRCCGTPWPCESWGYTSYAVVEWLIKMSNEIIDRYRRSEPISVTPARPQLRLIPGGNDVRHERVREGRRWHGHQARVGD